MRRTKHSSWREAWAVVEGMALFMLVGEDHAMYGRRYGH